MSYLRTFLLLAFALSQTLPIQAQTAAWEPEDATSVSLDELTHADLFDAPTSTWFEPPTARRDGNGVYRLDVRMARNVIEMDGTKYGVNLRAYNGGLVGPAIRFKAGELLRIDVNNNLPDEQDPTCREPHRHGNTPACPNLTNLHTHGLHVSPRPPADDVFQVIHPEGRFAYRYPVLPLGASGPNPPVHYPGTFWYHAHRHGSTAIQLASGMAGPLLLEGDIDNYPGVAGTKERIFVFQQLAWDRDGEIKTFSDILPNWAGCSTGPPACDPRHGPPKHTTINGRVKPLIKMDIGRVERWRWIDSGVFEMLDMELISMGGKVFPLHQIAIDGITLKEVTARDVVRMGPGYRTDLLVSPPEGEYFLYKRRAAFALAAGELDGLTIDNPQVLAKVVVGPNRCTDCPALLQPGDELPFPDKMLPDITKDEVLPARRTMIFGADRRPPVPRFLINGRQYEHGRIDQRPVLDTAEEWILGNNDPGPQGRPQGHPFHIHVNAFQMLDNDGNPREWHDTIIVPPGYPARELRMRTRYERFDGTFVLHCHILTHEDLGMMQAVQIVKPRETAP